MTLRRGVFGNLLAVGDTRRACLQRNSWWLFSCSFLFITVALDMFPLGDYPLETFIVLLFTNSVVPLVFSTEANGRCWYTLLCTYVFYKTIIIFQTPFCLLLLHMMVDYGFNFSALYTLYLLGDSLLGNKVLPVSFSFPILPHTPPFSNTTIFHCRNFTKTADQYRTN